MADRQRQRRAPHRYFAGTMDMALLAAERYEVRCSIRKPVRRTTAYNSVFYLNEVGVFGTAIPGIIPTATPTLADPKV
jgi:hypothetical protein